MSIPFKRPHPLWHRRSFVIAFLACGLLTGCIPHNDAAFRQFTDRGEPMSILVFVNVRSQSCSMPSPNHRIHGFTSFIDVQNDIRHGGHSIEFRSVTTGDEKIAALARALKQVHVIPQPEMLICDCEIEIRRPTGSVIYDAIFNPSSGKGYVNGCPVRFDHALSAWLIPEFLSQQGIPKFARESYGVRMRQGPAPTLDTDLPPASLSALPASVVTQGSPPHP